MFNAVSNLFEAVGTTCSTVNTGMTISHLKLGEMLTDAEASAIKHAKKKLGLSEVAAEAYVLGIDKFKARRKAIAKAEQLALKYASIIPTNTDTDTATSS